MLDNLDKAKAALEICGYYALGETLLYLGKVHQGLGGPVFLKQTREYVTNALAEFQRLELYHKEREAKGGVETIEIKYKIGCFRRHGKG